MVNNHLMKPLINKSQIRNVNFGKDCNNHFYNNEVFFKYTLPLININNYQQNKFN